MTSILLGSGVLIVLILLLSGLVIAARAILNPARPATLTLNGTTRIATETGRKLLAALNENGVMIPSACAGAGTCGLCRVQIVEGGPDPLPIETARLSPSELHSGVHLACQVTMRGDMAVRVPDDLLAAEAVMCRVASVRALTPLIREIVLDLPDDSRPDIFAGAFVQLTAPPFALDYAKIKVPDEHADIWAPLRSLSVDTSEPVTRAYSIANRPEDTAAGRIVLNIRLALPPPGVRDAKPGIVSSWLFNLSPGDTVSTAGPFGSFRARDSDREMVFIGGGVGMAPLRAMLFEQLEGLKSGRKVTFWYGARSKVDLFYEDELNALAAKHENFDWTVALSDPEPTDDWSGATGFVHRIALENYLRDHPAPEDCEYYLCGPPMMISAVMHMLDELGVEPDSIFNDDFGV